MIFPIMDDATQAVIFDFDGIVFRKGCRWKIINPRAGISGSLVGHEEGMKILNKMMESHPDTKVSEYFLIEDYIPEPFPTNGSVDIIPIEDIVQAADNHRFRGRDIFILSTKNFELFYFILDRIFHRYKNFPAQTNPFKYENNIIHLNPSGANELEAKINFFKNILKYSDEKNPVQTHIQIENREILRYEKIFYYHTQAEMVEPLSRFVNSDRTLFLEGQN
ncbi:MAG: hypothetical protein OEZ34_10850, partial [Spirochaetia bacterium]|nr:hypothetical protein [Spirochaetia bacterium]